jgi:hypothetical protein
MVETKICPICNEEIEDMRHVTIECFYAVHEVVPQMEQEKIYVEVPMKGNYLAKTYVYKEGIEERVCAIKKEDEDFIRYETVEHETKLPIRFVEKQSYISNCCKRCRADFLDVLRKWRNGDFISKEGDGDIPVRINGAIKMLTREQYDEYVVKKQKENDN